VTSYNFRTHAIPTAATGFTYGWNLDTNASISIFEEYQNFVTSPKLPANVGFDFGILPGASKGSLLIFLLGEFYGPVADFNKTMAPFWAAVPTPDIANVTSGTWIEAMEAVAVGPFNTSSAPVMRDAFYAKSLMTPQSTPISKPAIRDLITFCANEAFGFNGVSPLLFS
jgi:hypothetical protein